MSQHARFGTICVLVLAVFLAAWYFTQHDADTPSPPSVGSQRAELATDPPEQTADDAERIQTQTNVPTTIERLPPEQPQSISLPITPPSASAQPPTISAKVGAISGAVRVNGEPTRAYRVIGHFPDFQRRADVDANGSFTFKDVPTGEAILILEGVTGSPTSLVMNKHVEVAADCTTQVDFDLVEGTASLTGLVARDGQPLANISLSLAIEPEGQDPYRATTKTDAQGAYLFEKLPVGTAYVKVVRHTERYEEPVFEATLTDDATSRLDIEIAASARVEGQILGNPKGWQLMGALVRGSVPMPQPDLQTLFKIIQDRMVIGGTMSEDGVYDLKDIPPGRYTVIVYSTPPTGATDGFKQAGGEVIVEEGDEIVQSDLTLE
jgi:hypothetical protein